MSAFSDYLEEERPVHHLHPSISPSRHDTLENVAEADNNGQEGLKSSPRRLPRHHQFTIDASLRLWIEETVHPLWVQSTDQSSTIHNRVYEIN